MSTPTLVLTSISFCPSHEVSRNLYEHYAMGLTPYMTGKQHLSSVPKVFSAPHENRMTFVVICRQVLNEKCSQINIEDIVTLNVRVTCVTWLIYYHYQGMGFNMVQNPDNTLCPRKMYLGHASRNLSPLRYEVCCKFSPPHSIADNVICNLQAPSVLRTLLKSRLKMFKFD